MWKPALWLVFVAQLVLVLTPLIEGREGPDARAHVEEAGTRTHHAHDEADCSACTVRHLLAASEVVPPGAAPSRIVGALTLVTEGHSYSSGLRARTRSRAPPALT